MKGELKEYNNFWYVSSELIQFLIEYLKDLFIFVIYENFFFK